VHLLDDGFQHLKLARNVDIVLLTQEDVGDSLLPGGTCANRGAATAGPGCSCWCRRRRLRHWGVVQGLRRRAMA
jgi:tetraacyldisaccharide 4'-kinase